MKPSETLCGEIIKNSFYQSKKIPLALYPKIPACVGNPNPSENKKTPPLKLIYTLTPAKKTNLNSFLTLFLYKNGDLSSFSILNKSIKGYNAKLFPLAKNALFEDFRKKNRRYFIFIPKYS